MTIKYDSEDYYTKDDIPDTSKNDEIGNTERMLFVERSKLIANVVLKRLKSLDRD